MKELQLVSKAIPVVIRHSDGPTRSKNMAGRQNRVFHYTNTFDTITLTEWSAYHYHFESAQEFQMNEYRLLIMDLRLLTFWNYVVARTFAKPNPSCNSCTQLEISRNHGLSRDIESKLSPFRDATHYRPSTALCADDFISQWISEIVSRHTTALSVGITSFRLKLKLKECRMKPFPLSPTHWSRRDGHISDPWYIQRFPWSRNRRHRGRKEWCIR